jgi:tetratricopeptide (TPR) repeat protein
MIIKKAIFSIVFIALTTVPLLSGYDEALELYKRGEFMKSIFAVADVLLIEKDSDPTSDNYRLRFLAAHCHWRLGNYDKAMIHFVKTRQIKPESNDPLIDMALMNLEANRNARAEEYARAVLSKEADNSTALYVMGGVAFSRGNYAQAQEYYQKIIAAEAEHYAAYNALGKVFMAMGNYGNAETAFATAVALNSGSAEIYNNLAICYLRMDKAELAKENIDKALSLAPRNGSIKRNQTIIDDAL